MKSSTAPNTRVMAQVAHSVIQNRAEHKSFVINQAFTAATTAGTIIPVTQALIQGDNVDNRSGDKVTLGRLTLSLNVAVATAAVQSTIRVILFSDTMANGAVPTVSDVLQTASVVGRYQPVNVLKNRFRIFGDWAIPVVATASNHVVHKDFDMRSKMPIYYQDPSNIAGANSKNAIFVLVITDTGVNAPGYAYAIQLRYTDY